VATAERKFSRDICSAAPSTRQQAARAIGIRVNPDSTVTLPSWNVSDHFPVEIEF
jgi:hypothetical protein